MEKSLKNAFGFDDGDLQLNRQGIVSPLQHDLLGIYSKNFRRGNIAAIAAFTISSLMMASMPLIFGEQIKSHFAWIAILGTAGVILAIGIIFIAFGFYRARHLRSRILHVIEGTSSRSVKTFKSGRWTAYYVQVGDIKFQLDTRKKYDAILDDKLYRFYYIKYPPTHIVLSAEHFDGMKKSKSASAKTDSDTIKL